MAKLKEPKLCEDRGRFFIWINPKERHYFPAKKRAEAEDQRKRYLANLWLGNSSNPPESGKRSPPAQSAGYSPPPDANGVLVAKLCADFLKYAKERKNPGDYRSYKIACKTLLLRHSTLTTEEFDSYFLLQVQGEFVNAGYARDYCNKLVNLIISIFRWGEPRRLVPRGKRLELRAVEPVPYGQAQRESKERDDVSDEVVERTLPFLLRVYQAIVKILQLTGARPSEILRMKVGDIDRTDPKVWVYRPLLHKTARKKKRRTIVFGTEEQAILLPYLEAEWKNTDSAVFSPRDAVLEHKKALCDARQTPVQPSQVQRAERRKQRPKAKINEHFDTVTVGRRLRDTIQKANLELPPDQAISHWTLYQLRYSFISKMVEQYDENIAALMAGHSDTKMVRKIYDRSQERRMVLLKQKQDSASAEAE